MAVAAAGCQSDPYAQPGANPVLASAKSGKAPAKVTPTRGKASRGKPAPKVKPMARAATKPPPAARPSAPRPAKPTPPTGKATAVPKVAAAPTSKPAGRPATSKPSAGDDADPNLNWAGRFKAPKRPRSLLGAGAPSPNVGSLSGGGLRLKGLGFDSPGSGGLAGGRGAPSLGGGRLELAPPNPLGATGGDRPAASRPAPKAAPGPTSKGAAGGPSAPAVPPAAPKAAAPAPTVLSSGVIARVQGRPISKVDLDRAVGAFLKIYRATVTRTLPKGAVRLLRRKALETLISQELVFMRAAQLGITASAGEVRQAVARFRAEGGARLRKALQDAGLSDTEIHAKVKRQLIMKKYLMRLRSRIAVPETDLRKAYRATAGRSSALASHILVKVPGNKAGDAAALAKANKLLAMARTPGADFAQLARTHSAAGDASSGGSLGWLRKGDTVGALDAALFSMKAGEVRGPVRSAMGLHVLKVLEVKRAMSFQQARPRLKELLAMRMLQGTMLREVGDLRKGARIEVFVPWGRDLAQ